ncbi:zinc metallopeptidase [Marinihelvus fidelis]|uniref:Zinc metallopeptidase n=1 Tax=Marinihelvus fidelis TaxID=2613842 RepID=A0A5N0TF74_9GAMM|nr:zinc metallopeptidase [Marinihelvus fidelis]KAA9132767.1 zinc metallopeptidase [Marinihelvus fidelis]
MPWLILILLVVAIVYLPSWWVRRTMTRYNHPEDRYPSTGAELARHLLDEAGLDHVSVETTEHGDHYDPIEKAVRLAAERFHGHSLTAITVAAHEVGHALQDATGYAPLVARTRLVRLVRPLERCGAGILMLAPVLALLLRLPSAGLLMMAGGILVLGGATLVHLVTLPTELDASFQRAMPLLERDGILVSGDGPHARRILKAAALTYVAASLLSLLNVARWWAILRR